MKSEVINIKTPVSRVGNKTAILHILYALFPLHYGRFIDVFGGSGSVLLGKPTIDAFEVYNDFDRNLVNLFRCMKERTMVTIRELGFCNLNSREDFIAIRKFFDHETFDDRFLTEELMLTEIMLPPPEAAELKEIRKRITEDHDVRRAAMFLKLLRNSYSSSGKSFASQPFDIRKLFGLIQELEDRMANVVIENQDFETLIRHYDRPDAFFYADPPYFSTEDMYEVGFGWDDHVRLRETLGRIKGKFLLSYNDCPEIRELYDGFSLFDFSRTHSMAQRYEAGKEFKELLIANYDYYERENAKPKQLTLFDIYGDENYDYAVTDASGVATFSSILIGTGYTLEEVETPIRYVVPDNQTAAIEWNKVTNKSFDNVLKKWNLTVTKQDVETGSAQGDANLAGAKYGIYKGDELIDTYVTDADGKFTTKYYVCGTDWSIKELDSSEGYLVTPGNEQIGVDPKNYTAEYNSEAMKQYEQVKKGNIAIIKHTDDGQTQIETPEEGAEFAVYLKSAGSYDNAKDSERDYLICDENGFAQTKDLPYGRYTVQQIKGWEGRELLKPFDVFVSENGETYRYLINNANFYSYVKVVKIDSTTGKTIPASGIGFHIYDPSGNQIQMTFTYPTVTTIDTFYTDGDGMLITPEKLEYGKGYSLVEVSAPYGYVLNSDPVYFDITEENSTEENAVTVVIVEKENAPQMGVINVEKTGEYLASVVDTKDSKRLVYAVGGLAGAEYTVTAAEDIYTPDGTLRYGKDEVVATLVTKEDGKAVTEPLFLGRYHVVETKAP